MDAALQLLLARAFLAGTRVAGLMTFAPFFSSPGVPTRIKIGFTMLLTALLYPVYARFPVPTTLAAWMPSEASEIVIGILMGWTMQFVFEGMELAGQIIGFQFGFSLVNVIDPQSQVEITVMATMQELVTLLIFLQLGVHHWLLRSVAKSFDDLPPGTGVASMAAVEALMRFGGAMWLIGVQVALPVLFATMLADIAMGFLGKATPQFPVLFLGISVKTLLGLGILSIVVAYWPRILERHFNHAMSALQELMRLAH